MRKLYRAILVWFASGVYWLIERIHGDAIFELVQPMIPQWVIDPPFGALGNWAVSYGPPAVLFFVGLYLIVTDRRQVQQNNFKAGSARVKGVVTLGPIPNRQERALRNFVVKRTHFTIAEAACLLAGIEIQQEALTGPASGYLHDIKKRILSDSISSNADEFEIAYANMSKSGLGITAGQKSHDLRSSVEISKEVLAELADEFGVKIPGLKK